VPAEVGEEGSVLFQTEILAHHFHGQHLAIGQDGMGPR
jgi:hypothetical protein